MDFGKEREKKKKKKKRRGRRSNEFTSGPSIPN